ncbi:D-alanyl-D-alanine carboxypeptidase [uncultured Caudovirales phage]|uniref:D-alanyl-D-alanine carboxypeptidase n=1 Tax=uncultured Caudovirales phage TaxID=2100421 RepID=A0A6J7WLK4_9CAUD|nr:D-alanyl-D-alanine carboxypeptidase [uncultured Caudovirales phage]
MDKLTIDRIGQAHPKIREELKQYYIECNNKLPKGVRLRFAYVYRSVAEQNALYNQKPKVTNARGGQSMHQYGVAFDVVILVDKDNNGTFESIDWNIESPHFKTVVAYFKSKGYEHGGDWRNFKDYPHFQKAFGLSWQMLKNRIDIGMSFKDENGIIYPVL